jgi:hypothetical protein
VGWLWQYLRALENYTDVLAFCVLEGVFVVFDVAGLGGVDGVVAAHCAVVAWKPFCAALAEDDVAGDYVLFCGGGERVLVLVFLSGFCCFFVLRCVVGRVVVVVEEPE